MFVSKCSVNDFAFLPDGSFELGSGVAIPDRPRLECGAAPRSGRSPGRLCGCSGGPADAFDFQEHLGLQIAPEVFAYRQGAGKCGCGGQCASGSDCGCQACQAPVFAGPDAGGAWGLSLGGNRSQRERWFPAIPPCKWDPPLPYPGDEDRNFERRRCIPDNPLECLSGTVKRNTLNEWVRLTGCNPVISVEGNTRYHMCLCTYVPFDGPVMGPATPAPQRPPTNGNGHGDANAQVPRSFRDVVRDVLQGLLPSGPRHGQHARTIGPVRVL